LPTDIAFIVQGKFAKLRDIQHYRNLTIMYDWHSRPLDAAHRLIFKTKHDVSEEVSASFFRQRCTKPDSPIMSSCSQALGLLLRLARSKGSIKLDVSLTKDRSRAGFRNVVLF